MSLNTRKSRNRFLHETLDLEYLKCVCMSVCVYKIYCLVRNEQKTTGNRRGQSTFLTNAYESYMFNFFNLIKFQ